MNNQPTPEQLKKINTFTRRKLAAEEAYVFSVILADNEIDRNYEQFPLESLEKLGDLYIGKTGTLNHDPKDTNQCARLFDMELVREWRSTSFGMPYSYLKAWAYIVRCEKNADLILEIDAGIKKEISVGCAVDEVVCSICGANRKIALCSHEKGKIYGGKVCYHKLIRLTDAYEWSFVAVPAQRAKPAEPTKPTLTEDEEIFVRWAVEFGFKWAGREQCGDLWIYENEPIKGEIWEHGEDTNATRINTDKYPFSFVKWEDAEPVYLPDLLGE